MPQPLDKAALMKTLQLLRQNSQEDPVELLSPIYAELYSAIGLEKTMELYFLLGGQQLTFPQSFFKVSSLKEQIRREHDGTNIRELSQKYHRSEKTIRRFLAEKK